MATRYSNLTSVAVDKAHLCREKSKNMGNLSLLLFEIIIRRPNLLVDGEKLDRFIESLHREAIIC